MLSFLSASTLFELDSVILVVQEPVFHASLFESALRASWAIFWLNREAFEESGRRDELFEGLRRTLASLKTVRENAGLADVLALFQSPELAGLLRGTRVIFTADHGESLLEHGYFFNHGDFVYGPAANVPLLAAGAGSAGAIDSRPLSLSNVRARLLDPGPASGPPPREGTEHALFGESCFCRFPDLNDRLGFQLPLEIAQSPVVPDWQERWEEQANRAL